jgi:hypothetical protein
MMDVEWWHSRFSADREQVNSLVAEMLVTSSPTSGSVGVVGAS